MTFLFVIHYHVPVTSNKLSYQSRSATFGLLLVENSSPEMNKSSRIKHVLAWAVDKLRPNGDDVDFAAGAASDSPPSTVAAAEADNLAGTFGYDTCCLR